MTTTADQPSEDQLRYILRFSYRIARQLGCSHSDAKDIAQVAAMRITRSWGIKSVQRALAKSGSWNSYIAVTTRNAIRSEQKSRKSRKSREHSFEGYNPGVAPPAQEMPTDPTAIERYLATQRVVELAADLSDRQRECIEMRYIEGLKVIDISEYLSIPTDQVRTHLRRAHDHIRLKIEEERRRDAEEDNT